MKTKELKNKNKTDIEKDLSAKREELRALRANLSGSKSRNVKAIDSFKKDIARMLTELNGRGEEVKKVGSKK